MRLVLAMALAAALCRLSAAECRKLTSCSCSNEDGSVVDLSPLAGAGGPAFTQVGDDTFTYLYNPCTAFACGSAGGGAVCQQQDILPVSFTDFGQQSSARFSSGAGQLRLQYTSGDGIRTASVLLICDRSAAGATLRTAGAAGSNSVDLQLTSQYACPVGGGGGGASAGDILLIVFFSLLIVYLVAGVLVNRFLLQQTGIQLVPNLQMWKSLAGLVAEGARFSVGELRSRLPGQQREQQKYQEI